MGSIDSAYLDAFRVSLEEWTDERMVSRDELWALTMFSLYLVNLAEDDGWEYCGHSFKNALPLSILVVKAMMDDLPVVVFTSGRTTMACIRIFIRKLEQGLLEWTRDKYR